MVVLGFFLPPVSIILMTAPIILPPLKAAGFDLVWFGVVMTIVMEMGLIHPPVGLNLFVIKNIAPDIPLSEVIWGVLPFVGLMMVAVVVLCFAPGDRRLAARQADHDDALDLSRLPPQAKLGEVSASYADGGVMGLTAKLMTPPSAARTPPHAKRGEEKHDAAHESSRRRCASVRWRACTAAASL